MDDVACPDHNEELAVGTCSSCQREVCEVCLEEAGSPDEWECPDCGGYGVDFFDDDYDGEEDASPTYH